MRNAKKPVHILELEKPDLKEDRPFLTVSEAVPPLTLIARRYKKNLTNAKDLRFCVDKMDNEL